jgi:hypothetical protein
LTATRSDFTPSRSDFLRSYGFTAASNEYFVTKIIFSKHANRYSVLWILMGLGLIFAIACKIHVKIILITISIGAVAYRNLS